MTAAGRLPTRFLPFRLPDLKLDLDSTVVRNLDPASLINLSGIGAGLVVPIEGDGATIDPTLLLQIDGVVSGYMDAVEGMDVEDIGLGVVVPGPLQMPSLDTIMADPEIRDLAAFGVTHLSDLSESTTGLAAFLDGLGGESRKPGDTLRTGERFLLDGKDTPPPGAATPSTTSGKYHLDPNQMHPVQPESIVVTKHGAVVFKGGTGNIVFRTIVGSQNDFFGIEGVVKLWVIEDRPMIDIAQGRHRAEQEGPMYLTFFILSGMKEKTPVAVSHRMAPFAEIIVRNSYSGPDPATLADDNVAMSYPAGKETPGFPHLLEETKSWEGFPLDSMIEHHTFDAAGVLEFQGVTLVDRGNRVYSIYEDGAYVGNLNLADYPAPSIPREMSEPLSPSAIALRQRIFVDGEPGLIPFHSGSLFTKEGTSGHMVVRDGRAIVYDPPADVIEWMEDNGVPLDVIDEIVLTHAHIDHAAGAARLISRMPHRVSFAAAPVVEQQFVDMYHAMTLGQVERDVIRSMWDSHPLRMMEPWQSVNGLWFIWNHSFHSIPAVGYTLYSDKPGRPGARVVVSFSGDTQFDPTKVWDLVGKNDEATGRPIISDMVRAFTVTTQPLFGLINGAISIVDAGVGPLHPTVELLRTMYSAQIFRFGSLLLAYHEAPGKVEEAGLPYLGEGVGAAISLADLMQWKRPTSLDRKHLVIHQSLMRVPDFAERLSTGEIDQLARIGNIASFAEGEVIIEEGSLGDQIYLVIDGEVAIIREDETEPLAVRRSGIFGETAVATREPRNATVIATRPTRVAVFSGDRVTSLLKSAGIIQQWVDLAVLREAMAGIKSEKPILRDLDADAWDRILLHVESVSFRKDETILQEGERSRDVYIVRRGEVVIKEPGSPFTKWIDVGEGAVIGEMAAITGQPRSATVTAGSDVELLKIPEADLERILEIPQIRAAFVAMTVERKADRP